MSKEKNTEIPYTQVPEFKYQITQKYMLDYVENTKGPEDWIWYADLCDASQKEVTRGNKTFESLDIEKVRTAFIDRYFIDTFEAKKKTAKPTYKKKINDLRKKAEEALKQGKK